MRHRTLIAALLLILAVLLPGAAAAGVYEPEPWNPPAGLSTSTVRWGPVTIPAAPADHDDDHDHEGGEPGHGGHNGAAGEIVNRIAVDGQCSPLLTYTGLGDCVQMQIQKPCEDCYITGILPDLVKKGTDTSVNMDTGGMLHHLVLMNLSRPDITCAPYLDIPGLFNGTGLIHNLGFVQGGNQRIFAAGNERTSIQMGEGPTPYGYHLKKGDKLGLIFHLMNFHAHPLDVEFKFTFTWTKKATPVDPLWFDVDQCNDSERPVPAGYSELDWTGHLPVSGTLVGIAGHAHDQSIAVSLENLTQKRVSCVSTAGYAANSPYRPTGPGLGTVTSPTSPNTVTTDGHPGTTLAAYMGSVSDFNLCRPNDRWNFWDKYRIRATYHSTGTTHAMGLMIGYLKRS
ncbi:hypothetical protein GCM10027589_14460 [Actinocorallia lasiicapitis]